MDTTESILRAVVFHDGEAWIAQCLEYDICVQAPDTDVLRARLDVALGAERELSKQMNGSPFAGIDKAPDHFFKMWERCSSLIQPRECSDRVEVELALCA